MFSDLSIAAYFEDSNGYGAFTNNIIRHLVRRGVKVALTPLHGSTPPVDLLPFLNPAPPQVHDLIFTSISNNPSEIRAKVMFTMTETLTVPWEYGRDLKRCKAIIVPTEFSAQGIREWNPRVKLCPLGVTLPWSPISFSPFVFTAVATDHYCAARKRIQELTDMFTKTFPREEDVRLQLKRSSHCSKIHTFDSRVEIVATALNRKAYEALIHRTTVGVQPSAMEGWSLPTNEFMAAGRPVIAPLAGAIADYLKPQAAFEVDHTLARTPMDVFLGKGKIPYANMATIGKQMRFAYENKLEVARRGMKAFELAQKYTTHTMGERFYQLCRTLF